jgi:hypothetical protein
MALITVPKPPKSAYNPDRPATSLLKSHVEHMREAESKLPLRYRSEFYAKAVRTEGEAAEYIRDVTEAIHEAHADAEKRRSTRKRKRKFEIAAAADERPKNSSGARKRTSSAGKKSRTAKKRKK